MSGSTVELNLKTAVDADDTADYLTLSLADSLRTVDALFNNVTGHNHSGSHQGGPLGSGSISGDALADGAITSAKIADGTIDTVDLKDGAVTSAKILDGTIATLDLTANAVSQIVFAQGSAASPTTTSTSFADMPQMTCTLTTLAGSTLVCWLVSNLSHTTGGGVANLGLSIDGAAEVAQIGNNAPGAGTAFTMSTFWIFTGMTAAAHTVKGRWSTNAATLTAGGIQRHMLVIELRR